MFLANKPISSLRALLVSHTCRLRSILTCAAPAVHNAENSGHLPKSKQSGRSRSSDKTRKKKYRPQSVQLEIWRQGQPHFIVQELGIVKYTRRKRGQSAARYHDRGETPVVKYYGQPPGKRPMDLSKRLTVLLANKRDVQAVITQLEPGEKQQLENESLYSASVAYLMQLFKLDGTRVLVRRFPAVLTKEVQETQVRPCIDWLKSHEFHSWDFCKMVLRHDNRAKQLGGKALLKTFFSDLNVAVAEENLQKLRDLGMTKEDIKQVLVSNMTVIKARHSVQSRVENLHNVLPLLNSDVVSVESKITLYKSMFATEKGLFEQNLDMFIKLMDHYIKDKARVQQLVIDRPDVMQMRIGNELRPRLEHLKVIGLSHPQIVELIQDELEGSIKLLLP
mmetsp:Transcript_22976/g.37810  ORF Transcript_22976/g.37810 Transcript_22976/m.37810 type:complete len:392 (-) Transcript_22976:783-1958(-)